MNKPLDKTKSQTDWARVDAMTDDEIVYDEDTGPPFTGDEIRQGIENGFVSKGIEDFKRKMKDALKND